MVACGYIAAVTILMMGLMSILRQSSPWWQENTSMFTGQWMKTAFTKVSPTSGSFPPRGFDFPPPANSLTLCLSGELLDGQRGLVPSNFVDFVQEEETSSAQHRDTVAKEAGYLNHSSLASQRLGGVGLGGGTGLSSLLSDKKLDCLSTSSLGMDLLGPSSNGTGTLDVSIDEVGEDVVPYPRRINLIKQLAKSVIIGWDPPVVPPGWGSVSGYNVCVDKELRMSVPYGGRTKSLIEKLNLATNTYRITVQTITERGLSDELRCTMLVGKDVVVAPYYLRVDGITQGSSELSWMPSNSNYSHTIFLNGAEYDMVKAGGYRYKFLNLKPMTVYKVKVVALPHQVPWQLPMDQREKREISVEFCTQPSGESPECVTAVAAALSEIFS